MKKLILVLAVAVLISGCATTRAPSYLRISENTFSVTYEGKSVKTSKTEIEKEALIKACEITIANGFKYFLVTNKDFSNRSIMAPSAYGYGSFGSSRTSVYIEIKCFKENPPQDAIDAQEFLKYNKANE